MYLHSMFIVTSLCVCHPHSTLFTIPYMYLTLCLYVYRASMFIICYHLCTYGLGFRVLYVLDSMDYVYLRSMFIVTSLCVCHPHSTLLLYY